MDINLLKKMMPVMEAEYDGLMSQMVASAKQHKDVFVKCYHEFHALASELCKEAEEKDTEESYQTAIHAQYALIGLYAVAVQYASLEIFEDEHA